MKRKFSVFFVLLALFTRAYADVLLEAEAFRDKGGWCVDQQFMEQMGSPYLLAHGMGRPVADAVTSFQISKQGTYYVYVRTYNWTSPWYNGVGPGRFALSINSTQLNDNLGTEGNAWRWQRVGQIVLSPGQQEIRLTDLTGFDGRCDAIWLTLNPNAQPPRHNAIRVHKPQRAEKKYDLIVVGGGIAGMSAAASAARLGLQVALVNDRPLLGGNNSSEIRVHLGGWIEMQPYPELGGMQKEFGPSRGGNAQPADYYEDQKKMDWIRAEKNIDLYLNYRAIGVRMKGYKISRVVIQQIEDGSQLQLNGRLFSDCTGDATLGYLAGADYHMGRESKAEFNEDLAPELADSMTLGASVQWYSVPSKQDGSTFPEFNYGLTFDEQSAQQVTMGEWTWETGMNRNQITEFERIRDYGMLVVYSNWSYLKNHSQQRDKYRDRELGWVAYLAGKRESRRLMGDHVLTQNDIVNRVDYPDATFTTSWSIDLHQPDPENTKYFPGNEFKAITHHVLTYPYAVPYRCLYSRNVQNLFMAGRDISQSHVALGTTRVMRTTGMMGEVVGIAASLCVQHDVLPRGVYSSCLDELKELMRKGVNKKGLPNNQQYNQGGHLSD